MCDLATIIPPFQLAKGAQFLEPTITPVPVDLLIGQAHFICNALNTMDGISERYECPPNIDRRFYSYGAGLEYTDMRS